MLQELASRVADSPANVSALDAILVSPLDSQPSLKAVLTAAKENVYNLVQSRAAEHILKIIESSPAAEPERQRAAAQDQQRQRAAAEQRERTAAEQRQRAAAEQRERAAAQQRQRAAADRQREADQQRAVEDQQRRREAVEDRQQPDFSDIHTFAANRLIPEERAALAALADPFLFKGRTYDGFDPLFIQDMLDTTRARETNIRQLFAERSGTLLHTIIQYANDRNYNYITPNIVVMIRTETEWKHRIEFAAANWERDYNTYTRAYNVLADAPSSVDRIWRALVACVQLELTHLATSVTPLGELTTIDGRVFALVKSVGTGVMLPVQVVGVCYIHGPLNMVLNNPAIREAAMASLERRIKTNPWATQALETTDQGAARRRLVQDVSMRRPPPSWGARGRDVTDAIVMKAAAERDPDMYRWMRDVSAFSILKAAPTLTEKKRIDYGTSSSDAMDALLISRYNEFVEGRREEKFTANDVIGYGAESMAKAYDTGNEIRALLMFLTNCGASVEVLMRDWEESESYGVSAEYRVQFPGSKYHFFVRHYRGAPETPEMHDFDSVGLVHEAVDDGVNHITSYYRDVDDEPMMMDSNYTQHVPLAQVRGGGFVGPRKKKLGRILWRTGVMTGTDTTAGGGSARAKQLWTRVRESVRGQALEAGAIAEIMAEVVSASAVPEETMKRALAPAEWSNYDLALRLLDATRTAPQSGGKSCTALNAVLAAIVLAGAVAQGFHLP